jgi:hypothetical protein
MLYTVRQLPHTKTFASGLMGTTGQQEPIRYRQRCRGGRDSTISADARERTARRSSSPPSRNSWEPMYSSGSSFRACHNTLELGRYAELVRLPHQATARIARTFRGSCLTRLFAFDASVVECLTISSVQVESPSQDRKNAFAPKSTSLARKILFERPIPHRINSGPR